MFILAALLILFQEMVFEGCKSVWQLPSGASGETSPGSYASFVDGDLPSVMTCANYLKLPPYSCKVSTTVFWDDLSSLNLYN